MAPRNSCGPMNSYRGTTAAMAPLRLLACAHLPKLRSLGHGQDHGKARRRVSQPGTLRLSRLRPRQAQVTAWFRPSDASRCSPACAARTWCPGRRSSSSTTSARPAAAATRSTSSCTRTCWCPAGRAAAPSALRAGRPPPSQEAWPRESRLPRPRPGPGPCPGPAGGRAAAGREPVHRLRRLGPGRDGRTGHRPGLVRRQRPARQRGPGRPVPGSPQPGRPDPGRLGRRAPGGPGHRRVPLPGHQHRRPRRRNRERNPQWLVDARR
jgi:hypothetical protein